MMTTDNQGMTPSNNDNPADGGSQTISTTQIVNNTPKQGNRTDISSLPEDIQVYIRNLRSEAESKRRRADEADVTLTNERAAHTNALSERENAFKALTAERDTLKAEVERANKALTAQVEALRKAVPDSMKWTIPSYDDPHKLLEWFASNGEKLSARQAPTLDQGTGQQKQTETKTPEQIAEIKRRFHLK